SVPCAVVYHDPQAYGGERAIDRLRRTSQHWGMRRAYQQANRAVFTVPLDEVSWLPASPTKAFFAPVGTNLPEPAGEVAEPHAFQPAKTVAVFGVTGGAQVQIEARDIALVVKRVIQQVPGLRLVVLGRNSAEAKDYLERALNGRGVSLSVRGLLSADEIA